MHRNEGDVQPFDDSLKASFEREEIARPANRAFGENADHMAPPQRLPCPPERFEHLFGTPALDWDRFHQAQEPVDRLHLVIRSVDQETDEPLDAGPYQQSIDERYVVADQQGWPAEGDVFLPHDANSVHGVCEHPQGEANEKIR